MLNDEQYIQMQSMLVGLKSMANQIDIDGMREHARQEKNVVLTEYMDANGWTQNIEDLLVAIETLKGLGTKELGEALDELIDDGQVINS